MVFVFSANKIVLAVVFGFLALNFFNGFGNQAQLLPEDEVQTLQTISQKLELNHFWNNISDASCNRLTEDFNNRVIIEDKIVHNVTCECTYENNTVCHINRELLKGLNLTGVLPEEFGKLAHLEVLDDLSLNYFHGSIPPNFSRAPLRILSLFGNLLNGSIPEQIGDITTLTELLEDNQLGGLLPQKIGRLRNLETLILSANSFQGKIPESFGNLKNLTDFRIDGSRISGIIPSFIGNWTKIIRLDMQGTSMEGPVPEDISLLKDLVSFAFFIRRISDLVGSKPIPFPSLRGLNKLERLILRNSLISGTIPPYIGEMTNLKKL